MGGIKYSDTRSEARGDEAICDSDSSRPSRWERLKERYLKPLAKVTAAVVVGGAMAACGAKTGLLVEDMRPDGGDAHVTDDAGADSHEADAVAPEDTVTDDGATEVPPMPGTTVARNLIGDYLNREIGDRTPNIPGNPDAEYPLGGSDSAENANPFTDGAGGTLTTAPAESFLHRIDGAVFPPLVDRTIVDPDGPSYVERQTLWVKGDNHFDGAYFNGVVGRLGLLAYTVKFDGPEVEEAGIPVCIAARDDGDHGACIGWGDEINFFATAAHRVKVNFLGEEWVILKMSAPEGVLTDENALANGGMLTLAQEAAGSAILVPDSGRIDIDGLSIVSEGIEVHDGRSCAVITALGTGTTPPPGGVICPTETLYLTIGEAPHGGTYPVHVYRVYPGSVAADVAILSRELVLRDGQELDAEHGTNPGFRVALGWKNLGASAASPRPDALRAVVVYSDDIQDIATSGSEELEPGDSVPIIQNPEAWRLEYAGLTVGDADRIPLRFQMKRAPKDISASDGPILGGRQVRCRINAPYLEVESGAEGAVFSVHRSDAGGVGDLSDNRFMAVLADSGSPALCDSNGDGALDESDGPLMTGTVLMRVSSSSGDYGIAQYAARYLEGVKYAAIGDDSSEGGQIFIESRRSVEAGASGDLEDSALGSALESNLAGSSLCGSEKCADVYVLITETAGEGASAAFTDFWAFGIADTGNPADATFSFDSTGGGFFRLTSDGHMLYGHATANGMADAYEGPSPSGPVEGGMQLVEAGYVSERGSVFTGLRDDVVEFLMSHVLAKARWVIR